MADILSTEEILHKVKIGLGMPTEFQDPLLTIYIDEVIDFMVAGGVAESVARSHAAVGCILQGVNDLWNFQSGGTKFSPYFSQRLIQLAARGESNV